MSDVVVQGHNQSDGLLVTSAVSDAVRFVDNGSSTYEAIVTDSILDHTHAQYSRVDGSNLGAVKVRILGLNQRMDEKLLPWANPIDLSSNEVPLRGELVMVHYIRSNWYYSKKIPISNRIQENALIKMNEELNNRSSRTLGKSIINGVKSAFGAVATLGAEIVEAHQFGKYYKPDSRVRQLMHFEGDTIIQGRRGNTIRLGSSANYPNNTGLAPNIIMRAGQGKGIEDDKCSIDAVFGLTVEDINRDASSIWMVSDQAIPLLPSTTDAGSFYRSILNPPNKFDKASITLNSDKLLLNSKRGHIMLFANEEIYLNSCTRTSIDSDENIILTALKDVQLKTTRNVDNTADVDFTVRAGEDVSILGVQRISLLSNKIYLGSASSDVEPVVGGTSLAMFLARLILVLMGPGAVAPQPRYQDFGAPFPATFLPVLATPGLANFSHVITPLGPGLLNPTILTGLQTLYAELVQSNPGSRTALPFSGAVFNSFDSYVSLANEDPAIGFVANKFEQGEQLDVENNEWNFSDEYYRVE